MDAANVILEYELYFQIKIIIIIILLKTALKEFLWRQHGFDN